MVKDAERYRTEDNQEDSCRLKNQLDAWSIPLGVITKTADMISEADADIIMEALENAEDALETNDLDKIKKHTIFYLRPLSDLVQHLSRKSNRLLDQPGR